MDKQQETKPQTAADQVISLLTSIDASLKLMVAALTPKGGA